MQSHERFRRLLDRLQSPDDDIVCDLTPVHPDNLPIVVSAFQEERNAKRRAALVRIVWESREAEGVPLLGSALADSADSVWKEALDGLVAIGGPEALQALRQARARLTTDARDSNKREWIDEAVDQINEQAPPA